MEHNISLISMISTMLVLLPILVLVTNNHILSAKSKATQIQLGGSLAFAIVAFASQSVFMLGVSVIFFICYSYRLCRYFVVSFECIKHKTKVPQRLRP